MKEVIDPKRTEGRDDHRLGKPAYTNFFRERPDWQIAVNFRRGFCNLQILGLIRVAAEHKFSPLRAQLLPNRVD